MPVVELAVASATFANALTQTSAEAESLHGRKAKTPMLAGAIIGSIMGVAYIIGFTIYFVKRWKRKQHHRRVAAGKAEPKVEPEPKERIVIPPDPAVLLGQHKPGDVVVVDEKRHHRQKSVPQVNGDSGSTSHLVHTDTGRISEEVPANV